MLSGSLPLQPTPESFVLRLYPQGSAINQHRKGLFTLQFQNRPIYTPVGSLGFHSLSASLDSKSILVIVLLQFCIFPQILSSEGLKLPHTNQIKFTHSYSFEVEITKLVQMRKLGSIEIVVTYLKVIEKSLAQQGTRI